MFGPYIRAIYERVANATGVRTIWFDPVRVLKAAFRICDSVRPGG